MTVDEFMFNINSVEEVEIRCGQQSIYYKADGSNWRQTLSDDFGLHRVYYIEVYFNTKRRTAVLKLNIERKIL